MLLPLDPPEMPASLPNNDEVVEAHVEPGTGLVIVPPAVRGAAAVGEPGGAGGLPGALAPQQNNVDTQEQQQPVPPVPAELVQVHLSLISLIA